MHADVPLEREKGGTGQGGVEGESVRRERLGCWSVREGLEVDDNDKGAGGAGAGKK